MNRTYTHPDVTTKGVHEGWADPETDPTRIDWTARQRSAAIPFRVVDGRPVAPAPSTGIRYGRGELGHWGEQLCADAIVTADGIGDGGLWLLMVERGDGHGWAVPGGTVDAGESAPAAAVRELAEETGLDLESAEWEILPARLVPDPRASDEAWMVTVPARTHLDLWYGEELPMVEGADDAKRAAWVRANSYAELVEYLAETYRGKVFDAHVPMLRAVLD